MPNDRDPTIPLPTSAEPPPRAIAYRGAPLIVVSGPSGVGKTTLMERVLQESRLPLRRAITATTRAPRVGETDGSSYHFWSVEEFRRAIDDGRMLEWAVVHGRDFYGTPRSEVDPYRAAGHGVLLVIDVQGAEQVRAVYPGDHLSVFITAPEGELESRLRARATEPEAKILARLETARRERERAAEFDRLIVNNELEAAVSELNQLIRDQFTLRG